MADDLLSDVLRLAEIQSVVSGGFAAEGEWAIRFPPPDKIKFFAAVKGTCWIQFAQVATPIRFEAGDVILLAAERGFTLASEPSAAPVDAREVFAGHAGRIVSVGKPVDPDEQNADGQVLRIGGHVRVHPAYGKSLAEVLPPFIHVRGAAPEAQAVRRVLDQLLLEREDLPGAGLVASQLALLLFVHILRAHLATGAHLRAGWLRAAADPHIAPALRLMHGEPGRAWRLDELASAAAMSRTRFATHFKTVAGEAPLTYLARWRMRLAEHALRRGHVRLSVLAQTLGYASESAFSNAFKRIVGQSPKHYAAGHREAPPYGQAA